MAAFNNSGAYTHAIAVVSAGLQSGALKLNGPGMGDSAAEKDAKYLNDLINSLAKNLQAS